MSDYSEGNDFEDILERLLSKISDDIDKRQGSIIYDALAPAAAELAQCYIALDVFVDQTYLLNAVGENLDNRVSDYGLTRQKSTYAQRIITIYDTNSQLMDVDIGTRFSAPNDSGGYNFKIIEKRSLGVYIAECETAGIVGNDFTGELLPLVSVNNLGTALMSDVYKPGKNEETDEELRDRALLKINQEAFAGNKASYMQFVKAIDGVGDCKIFPAWNGGGTVKVAVITADNDIPSSSFIAQLQEKIDPTEHTGEGQGFAPIGHKVTVVAPDKLNINITATLELTTGYTAAQLKPSITEKLTEYINEVQDKWSDASTLTIYTSRVIAAILSVNQVTNVSNLTINGEAKDLTITLSGTNVKFPMLNEVTLNES
jgi:uncharacterized phage protein gp47/JayE